MRKVSLVAVLCAMVSMGGMPPVGAASCSVSTTANLTAALSNAACDPIIVAPGTYAGPFSISRGVTVRGAGAEVSILQGNGASPVVVPNTTDSVTLSGLTITGGGGGAGGGGIRKQNSGTLTILRTVVRNNSVSSTGGGGVHNSGGQTYVIESSIRNNTANATGGGIYNGSATLIVERSTISGNHATLLGGGVNNGIVGGSATLTDVTISGNTSDGPGGGFAAGSANTTASFANVTIVGNTADLDGSGGNGGGIYSVDPGNPLELQNSIVADNVDGSAGDNHPDCAGHVERQGWVLLRSQTTECQLAAGDDPTGYLTSVSPGLGPLANNGGPTLTHALTPNSAAVNSGGGCGAVDQRGAPRGSVCDRGAYELVRCLRGIVNRVGTAGNDVMNGSGANEVFLAMAGDDVARGRGGKDRICGGGGRDRLSGGSGKDRLSGGGGRDRLSGGRGIDRLNGGGGSRDVCRGGPGDDAYARCEETPS